MNSAYQNVCHGQYWELLLFWFLSYLPIDLIDHGQITKKLTGQEFSFSPTKHIYDHSDKLSSPVKFH